MAPTHSSSPVSAAPFPIAEVWLQWMEGNREMKGSSTPPSAALAAAISAVLGDDNLLREIVLRLGFPTTLVCAALVSKRWLRHASDPAFLRRFRERHPPALLGFYAREMGSWRPQFVPVSQSPELSAAIRRASVTDGQFFISHCRNGRLLVRDLDPTSCRHAVLSPLQPTCAKAILPPPPKQSRIWFFLSEREEEGSDDGAIAVLWLLLPVGTETKLQVDLLNLRSGVWVVRRSEVILLPEKLPPIRYMLPPVRGKIYGLTKSGHVLRLDMTAGTSSLLRLPDRVRTDNFMISCGDQDAKLSLVHADGYQLSVWHLPTSSSDANDWLLVYDKIHVREACSRREDVLVMAVDDNLEFVFLWLRSSAVLMHMHLPSRREKVYTELNLRDFCGGHFLDITLFMALWPPVFPALMEEDNLEE